jgi:RTX calcium-binding nonapeptide repeat (4 copies)
MKRQEGWMPARIARRRWIAFPLVLIATLLPAASAQAALGLANAVATPADTSAGHHSNFTLSFDITGADHIRNLVTELPPGLVGNPQSAGFCVPTQLMNNACPANSVIGSASSNVTATVADLNPLPITIPVTMAATGTVYNMIPQGNDPATLGIVLTALNAAPIVASDPVILIGHASARSSDFGLNTTILDIPQTARVTFLPLLGGSAVTQTSPVHINSTALTLNSSFMTNPTSCGTKTTRITGTSYEGDTQTITASFNSINCGAQAYNPNLGVTIDMTGDATTVLNPELTTEVTQGLDQANSRRVEAILPKTVQANNATLNNQCPASSFPLDPAVPQGCSKSTQVGTAVARTPLLSQPLQGPVYLIQNPGLLPKVGLDLKGPLPARIIGNATPTSDFRLDNVFGDVPPGLPDVPLSSFRLTFGGGKGGLIVATDSICDGPSVYNAKFDSFGGQHKEQTSNAKVIGCGFAKLLKKNRCHHRKLTDVGTKHADRIRGTKGRDVINGLGGKDKIVGLKGNDLLCGGAGKDKILGGSGKDQLFGGRGRDKLVGGPGKDKLAGGPGKDRQKQ